MDGQKLFRIFLYLGLIGAVKGVLLFMITCRIIRDEVNRLCTDATAKYSGDCVEALIQALDQPDEPFHQRNSTIWALGQLGDARALPVLKGYYTGNIPQRESLDAGISQYALKKAIRLAGGGLNLTRWMWEVENK